MEQAKKKLFLPQSSENIWVGLVLFNPFKFLKKTAGMSSVPVIFLMRMLQFNFLHI